MVSHSSPTSAFRLAAVGVLPLTMLFAAASLAQPNPPTRGLRAPLTTSASLPHAIRATTRSIPRTLPNPSISAVVARQRMQLSMVRRAIQIYYVAHRAFPATLDQLTTPVAILKEVPKDLFAPSRSLSYRLIPSDGTTVTFAHPPRSVVICSLGDSSQNNQVRTGPLSIKITRDELEMRAPVLPPKLDMQSLAQVPRDLYGLDYMEELLKLRAREKRDNAMIYYALASWVWPGPGSVEDRDLENEALRKGWTDESSATLEVYLASFQPAFVYIRRGVALDRAEGIGAPLNVHTPLPNSLAASICAKALCVEGRCFEHEGRTTDALNDYLSALTMARDHSAPGNMLNTHRNSVDMGARALGQIGRLVASGLLTCDALTSAIVRLQQIERTQGTSAAAYRDEQMAQTSFLREIARDPKAMKAAIWHPYRIDENEQVGEVDVPYPEGAKNDSLVTRFVIEVRYQIDYETAVLKKRWEAWRRREEKRRQNAEVDEAVDTYALHADEIARHRKDLEDITARYLDTPYWQRDLARFERERQALPLSRIKDVWNVMGQDPLTSESYFLKYDVGSIATRSLLRQTQIAAALELHRIAAGRYPERLIALKPKYLKYVPQDPFSGADFAYFSALDGKSYNLLGAGPGSSRLPRKPSDGALIYDVTNGTQSTGNVFLEGDLALRRKTDDGAKVPHGSGQ